MYLATGGSVATYAGARIAAVHNSDTVDTDIKTTTETHTGIHASTTDAKRFTRTGMADAKPSTHTGTADAKRFTRIGTADARPSTCAGMADAKRSTRTGTADAKSGDVGTSPNRMAHPVLLGSIDPLDGMPRPQPSGGDRRETRALRNGELECRRTERLYGGDR